MDPTQTQLLLQALQQGQGQSGMPPGGAGLGAGMGGQAAPFSPQAQPPQPAAPPAPMPGGPSIAATQGGSLGSGPIPPNMYGALMQPPPAY